MGFAGIWRSTDPPSIWGEIESTKHTDIHQFMITCQLAIWALQEGTELSPGFFFDDTLVKEWAALKFHQGDIHA